MQISTKLVFLKNTTMVKAYTNHGNCLMYYDFSLSKDENLKKASESLDNTCVEFAGISITFGKLQDTLDALEKLK